MLFLLLWLYSIVWSWVLSYLQCCSFCSVLPWLLMIFCGSKWTYGWFSISVMNVIQILMGIALNICIAFGNVAIFTVLFLPIHEHGRFFYLLNSPLLLFQ
jgi:hypothetical protein